MNMFLFWVFIICLLPFCFIEDILIIILDFIYKYKKLFSTIIIFLYVFLDFISADFGILGKVKIISHFLGFYEKENFYPFIKNTYYLILIISFFLIIDQCFDLLKQFLFTDKTKICKSEKYIFFKEMFYKFMITVFFVFVFDNLNLKDKIQNNMDKIQYRISREKFGHISTKIIEDFKESENISEDFIPQEILSLKPIIIQSCHIKLQKTNLSQNIINDVCNEIYKDIKESKEKQNIIKELIFWL